MGQVIFLFYFFLVIIVVVGSHWSFFFPAFVRIMEISHGLGLANLALAGCGELTKRTNKQTDGLIDERGRPKVEL